VIKAQGGLQQADKPAAGRMTTETSCFQTSPIADGEGTIMGLLSAISASMLEPPRDQLQFANLHRRLRGHISALDKGHHQTASYI